jgi:alpha-L-fucosidase 2
MRRLLLALIGSALLASPVRAEDTLRLASKNDVIYGVVDGAGLLADLTYPEGRNALPAIVMVHGGRWRAGSKNEVRYARGNVWATAGFFAMDIDYRLVGSSPAPGCYEDLYTAIRWIYTHAAEYKIDTNRLYLIGDSSGGHEVSLAATLGAGPYPKTGGWESAPSEIKAVISISGAYDLNTLSWGNLWTPLTGEARIGFTTLSGPALEEARRMASPIRHIGPQTKPMLLLHSDDDRSVPVQQAIDMDGALTAANVFHKFIHYKDHGHMAFTDEAFKEALAFITEFEKRK